MRDDDAYDEPTPVRRIMPEDDRTNPVQAIPPELANLDVDATTEHIAPSDDIITAPTPKKRRPTEQRGFDMAALGPPPSEDVTHVGTVPEDVTVARPRPKRPEPYASAAAQRPQPQAPKPSRPPTGRYGAQQHSPSARPQPTQPEPQQPAPSARSLQPRPDREQRPPTQGVVQADVNDQLKRLGMTRRKAPNANNIRPNSGFYSLPEANPSASVDATVMHHYSERDPYLLGLLVALAVGSAGGIGVLAMSVSRWAAPVEALGYALLATVLAAVVVGGVALPDEGLRKSNIKDTMLPIGIAAALAIMTGVAWQLPPIRWELRAVASSNPETSKLVLADAADSIAVKECVRIADRYEYKLWREVLVEGLVARPGVRIECFSQLEPEVANAISETFADRWTDELLTTASGDAACMVADSLASLQRPQGDVESRLLTCLLKAPDESAQACCGASIVGLGDDAWMADFDATAFGDDPKIAAGLMTLAFHQQGVNSAQREFVKAASFQGDKARWMAIRVGCEGIRRGGAGLDNHFGASVGEDCPVDQGSLPKGRDLWALACGELETEAAQKKPPQAQLCETARGALVTTAISDASRIIQNSAKDRSSAARMGTAIDVQGTKAELEKPKVRSIGKFGASIIEKKRRENRAKQPTFKPNW